jgi:hypothetical protein
MTVPRNILNQVVFLYFLGCVAYTASSERQAETREQDMVSRKTVVTKFKNIPGGSEEKLRSVVCPIVENRILIPGTGSGSSTVSFGPMYYVASATHPAHLTPNY